MEALSRYMAAAKNRPLPAGVLEAVTHHVLDTLAAMISGSGTPAGEVRSLFAATLGEQPVATVTSSMIVASPMDAALINGVLAQSDETDDSHGDSQSHPGSAVVPAALAAAELYGITGAEFCRAVALGYDVGPRVTMALGGVNFRNDTRRSTHSIAGTFGAAAAAGCAASLDATKMRWLLDYASQESSGFAAWERDTDHIEKGFVFGGMPLATESPPPCSCARDSGGVDDVFLLEPLALLPGERTRRRERADSRPSANRYEWRALTSEVDGRHADPGRRWRDRDLRRQNRSQAEDGVWFRVHMA